MRISEGVIKVNQDLVNKIEAKVIELTVKFVNYHMTDLAEQGEGTTENFRASLKKVITKYNLDVDLDKPKRVSYEYMYGFGRVVNNDPTTRFDLLVNFSFSQDHKGQFTPKNPEHDAIISILPTNIFSFDFDFDSQIFKPDVKTNELVSMFARGIVMLRRTIQHELMHGVQYFVYAEKDPRQIGGSSSYRDGNTNYFHRDIEFYPLLHSHVGTFITKLGGISSVKRIAKAEPQDLSKAIKAFLGLSEGYQVSFGVFDYTIRPNPFFAALRGKEGMFNFKRAAREFVKELDHTLNTEVEVNFESVNEGRFDSENTYKPEANHSIAEYQSMFWYHGTEEDFDSFDDDHINSKIGNRAGIGFWFAQNPKLTGFYGPNQYKVKLHFRNPLVLTDEEFNDRSQSKTRIIMQAYHDGHDAIIIQDTIDGDDESTVCCVFNTDDITIIDKDIYDDE